MDWFWNGSSYFGVFGFVIAIILINAVASVIKNAQQQQTIREMLKNGQPLDEKMIESLGVEREGRGSSVTAGFILIAVAVALVLLGYFGGNISDEPDAAIAMLGVAAFPGLIGLVLIISGMLNRPNE
ncbi:DUF6249 domain-containing protein [Parvularcula sp. IMCC14364]|uniref:DUF6249 domain-containing protein n=1 Tax=Parvularcula sp. IMCC14364 TaxID=3067902 RepID=UPI002742437D|nr:DUF6249 domain-containing protein [Parvularcula sp. IMCC14364]